MRAMNERNTNGVAGALCAVGFVCLVSVTACGGGAKGADSPENCTGPDCSPSTTSSSPSHHNSEDAWSSSSSDTSSGGSSAASAPAEAPPASGSSTPYQKDAVEVELKRAARQVKANCGSATDENGTAAGPWGKTTASVTLGRNGHIKDVSVPAPYAGAPEGDCAVNAFKKIQFPPYASSSDVTVQWDVEFVKPKH
jgi:hypothetical protein